MGKPQKKIGELLLESKLITPDQLDEALKIQKRDGGLIGIILVNLNYLNPTELARVLDTQREGA